VQKTKRTTKKKYSKQSKQTIFPLKEKEKEI